MCFLFELTSVQANNQWNIGAELGSDPMESAFALTLTSGIKGVAMVLDREVQPLTSGSTNCGACQEVKEMYLSLSHSVSFFFYFLTFLALAQKKPFAQRAETSELRSLVFIRIFPVQPGALGVGFCHQRWRDR